MTIIYKTTDIKFLYGDAIAFPVGIKVYDNDGNTVSDWDLTRKPDEDETDQ